jgi:hypothetical protein
MYWLTDKVMFKKLSSEVSKSKYSSDTCSKGINGIIPKKVEKQQILSFSLFLFYLSRKINKLHIIQFPVVAISFV